jgi:hypothetical protein
MRRSDLSTWRLDQSAGGGNAQDRLGDEGPGEGAPILRRAADATGRLGNEGLEADHVEGRDDTPERFGDRLDLLAQPRKQRALNVVPAGLHGVERIVAHANCCRSERRIAQYHTPHSMRA